MVNLNDTVYALFNNRITDSIGNILSTTGLLTPKVQQVASTVTVVKQIPLWQLCRDTGPFVRFAGLLGASAVVLGAYGAHRQYPVDSKIDYKRIYETANRFHFIHSLALLGAPLCRKPYLSGTFFVLGMTLFCGACYYHAFTGDRMFQRLAPIGGTCLILGWLAMVL